YQYEYEEAEELASGPMAQEGSLANTNTTKIFPNPFVKRLNIRLDNSSDGKASIRIYDISGRLVKNLHEGVIRANSLLTWDGTDDNGKIASQGIYFVQIRDSKGKFMVHKVLKVN
ncbi:MAG: T9SS type A sorting domain-containing protein, partial [bacterium]